jgi:riboflavin kinase / FMN adenylyltransferase
MDIIHITHDTCVPASLRGSVVAMGNFDGVHRGHAALLHTAKHIAQDNKKPFGIVTFEPHPRSFFRPDDAPFRLTPSPLKYELLENLGCDAVFVMPFDAPLAHCTADDFAAHYLQKIIGISHCVIGSDFHFGHERKGSITTLEQHGISCTGVDLMKDKDGGVISASRIRALLQSGLIDQANELLGWTWELRGIVIKGDQRGRTIGFPTANMMMGDTLHPAFGAYAAQVKIKDATTLYNSAVNIGVRPMFESKQPLLEAHILDFDGDLYGQEIRVFLHQKLRGEAKYPSLDALIAQIQKDCDATRHFFAQNP